MVPAVDGREWLVRGAVEGSPQPSGDWMAIGGGDAQVETFAQFFAGGIAEGRGGLGETNGCGAGHVTVDCGCRAAFCYQAELCLQIGCRLDFAEQETQQDPREGQGQQSETQSIPRSHETDENEQQDGGDEHAGRDPLPGAEHDAATEP